MDALPAIQTRKCLDRRSRVRTRAGPDGLKKGRTALFQHPVLAFGFRTTMPASDETPGRSDPPEHLHDHLSALFHRHGIRLAAAELHGIVTGLVAAGTEDAPDRGLVLAGASEGAGAVRDALEGLTESAHRALDSGSLEFRLLLASEDSGIGERVVSLADWCQGFLLGLLDGDGNRIERLPGEAGEAARDIMAISQMSPEIDADLGSPERDLMELEEYVRVGVQLIYEELNPHRHDPPAA
jgi:hypothetical protein